MTLRVVLPLLCLLALYGFASTTEPRPISTAAVVRGEASWYCRTDPRYWPSVCTKGYGPSDMVAAIDPTTGIEKGERVRVTSGERSVTVRIVDVCACPGARVIDLTSGAFSRLAPLSAGVVRVSVSRVGEAVPTLPATDVAP